MRVVALCVILIFLGVELQAQETVSDFLLTAFEDGAINEYDSQLDFINLKNTRLPVIDEVEIRYGNDERTLEDSRYQFRVRPANPWTIRRNNALFNARKAELSAEKELQFKKSLMDRYQLTLRYFKEQEFQQLYRKKLDLLSRKTELFAEYPGSDFFSARDFAKSKIEEVEVLEEWNNQQVNANNTIMEISVLMGTSEPDWQSFEMININSVDSQAMLISAREFTSTELMVLTRRFETARQETRVERSDFDIGFLQAEYAPFIDADKTSLGFSFGVTLPIFKKNKPQIAERMLDQLRRENILIAESRLDSIDKALEYGFLMNLIKQHAQLQEDIKTLNLNELKTNLARSEDFDPIALIELEEAAFILDEIILKSKYRVLEQYLDFLYTYNSIVEKPVLNYLAQELTPLE